MASESSKSFPFVTGKCTVASTTAFVLVAVSLAALLLHAYEYLFLTDDAYISFRYAKNLAGGHGLVFNPGYERVEGYTNFLWVLLLSGFSAAGIPLGKAAHLLSLMATVGLWSLLLWFGWRLHGRSGLGLPVIAPLFLFASIRSVAVWSTSGLETRFFTFLVVAGVLRLLIESEALDRTAAGYPIAALLFSLASLTRPEAYLVCFSAYAVMLAYNWRRFRGYAAWAARSAAIFALIAGGHLLFRHLYYGSLFPNTYYVKIGGSFSWDMGLRYLGAFCLEYSLYLYLPLLAAAIFYHARKGSLLVPLVFASVVLPHLGYLAAIGGDHFEYRPLDLFFPFFFLLIGSGVASIARRGRLSRFVLIFVLAALAIFSFELPARSRLQFPDRYAPGFPGGITEKVIGSAYHGPAVSSAEASRFLDPERTLLFRLPGLRNAASAHQHLIRALTARFVGIRQEEHQLFLGTVAPEGVKLRKLVEEGLFPPDTYVSFDCVGAIPYLSGVRVLDRLGLTDAHVAKGETTSPLMAHEKQASFEYAASRRVDLWAVDYVHLFWSMNASQFWNKLFHLRRRGDEAYVAEVGDDTMLFVKLPRGITETRRRFPRLKFYSIHDEALLRLYISRQGSSVRLLRGHYTSVLSQR